MVLPCTPHTSQLTPQVPCLIAAAQSCYWPSSCCMLDQQSSLPRQAVSAPQDDNQTTVNDITRGISSTPHVDTKNSSWQAYRKVQVSYSASCLPSQPAQQLQKAQPQQACSHSPPAEGLQHSSWLNQHGLLQVHPRRQLEEPAVIAVADTALEHLQVMLCVPWCLVGCKTRSWVS